MDESIVIQSEPPQLVVEQVASAVHVDQQKNEETEDQREQIDTSKVGSSAQIISSPILAKRESSMEKTPEANGLATPRPAEEEEAPASNSSATNPASASGKKVSAKELVQHVKNQKRKLDEKELEISSLSQKIKETRMRALATIIDVVGNAKMEKKMVRAFHRWLAYAERESAAVEVERVASLAHRVGSEMEELKVQLEAVRKEKADMEITAKKLKGLLAKARQQLTEHASVHEKVPEGFSAEDVLRKLRGPDGTVYCLIITKRQPAPVYEWREEKLVLSWLSAGRGGEQAVRDRPTVEEELQDRYTHTSKELEATLADKQHELDALTDRFEQYRRRAELALQKAESSVQTHDSSAENALREELSRVARERDSLTEKLEDLRAKLDATESSLAALRLREKTLREERDDLELRAAEAGRTLEVARAAWEKSLTRLELETEERLRAEKSEASAILAKAESLERQLAQALQRENELKEKDRTNQEALSKAEDRIEALRAAVSRAEAKANSAELSRHLASSSVLQTPALSLANASAARQGSVISALSSPRLNSNSTSKVYDAVDPGDSVSVAEVTRPRRDSENSEMSGSFIGGGGFGEVGSKYFVDQIGALRAAQRNERAEWQRERTSLREQVDDALKRKEMMEEKVVQVEKKITEMTLANERQKQLTESARTLGETPDGLLYLKNAVFRFITADEDSERETLLPVITLLLKFTPEEVQVLSREATRPPPGSGLLGGLMSRFVS